ncbi:MAG: hypothetical protein GOU98_00835 [Candidatus Altiarchaeota archaeon]|nr:hypothetical protein [Candidatus Altiarchaeota archaeon]
MQDLKGKFKVAASAAAGALMLGSTLAGAFAADLGTLPLPFVADNNMVGQVVVGANAAVPDVIAAAQLTAAFGEYLVKAESSSSTTTASGGRLEEILMGKALTFTGQFPATLKNNHVSTLRQGELSFKSSQYDYREEIVLSTGAQIVTGQDDRDKDYDTSKAFLSLDKGSILYKFNFYGSSKPNASLVTTSDTLELSILGHDIKITAADASDAITAEVGTKVSLKTDESTTVDGKTVVVTAIGESSVLVTVDGVTSGEPIDKTDNDGLLVNGLRVKVTGLIYQSNTPENSLVSLLIGKDDVSEEYTDGEAFIGEDENDPTWVWDIDVGADGAIAYLGVKNEKAWDNYKDSPIMVGDAFLLPNDYAKIELQSMLPDADRTYTFEFETGISLYDLTGDTELFADAKIIRVSTSSDTGFTDATNDAADIAIYFYEDVWAGNSTDDVIAIFFKDGSKYKFGENVTFAGGASATETVQTSWYLQYGDSLPYLALENNGANIGVHIQLDDVTGSTDVNSTIILNATVSSSHFTHLGTTAEESEASDVYVDDNDRTAVGTFDGSLLTHYGAILSSVKSNADSDEVVIKMPDAQTKIQAFIGGGSGSTTTVAGDVTYIMTALNTEVAVLDSEADTSGTPLVIVGGPYANTVAKTLIGSDDAAIQDFFGYDGTSGKGVVKLYDASATPFSAQAMVVAGWDAKDTRAAAYMLSQYLTGAKDISALSGLAERKVTASSATSYVEE